MNNFNKDLCMVTQTDTIIGTTKAYTAHLLIPQLHRAFSIFLFNTNNKLLLQKRASDKLVYPSCYTNTCCSHPFININSFIDPVKDCKLHAIERLNYELGIINIGIEDLYFVERILYYADNNVVNGRMIGCDVKKQEYVNFGIEDNVEINRDLKSENFGEYEIDYIFYCKKDVECNFRRSEVELIEYVDEIGMKEILGERKCSPWMKLISNEMDIFKLYEKYQESSII